MSKTCVIVCRGKSSSRLAELKDVYDICLLVNEWQSELDKFDFISQFISKQPKVIHVLNRDGRSLLRKEQYEKYDIHHCQLNVRQPEYLQSPLYHTLSLSDVKSKYLSEDLVPISKTGAGGFPSTGVLAIAHAAKVLQATIIDIIGLDFFEDDYFSHHSHSMKPAVQDYQRKKGIVMKEYTGQLLKQFPNITFTFFTNSMFNPHLKNVKIVQ